MKKLVLYKVRVRGVYSDKGDVKPHYMKFLVHAKDASAALKLGDKLAEDRAPIGHKWLEFCTLSAAPITLPILVSDLL